MGSRLEKNSERIRKRIENHHFDAEDGDEYEGSSFGGFPEYFRRKKIKLQNLDAELRKNSTKPQVFRGVVAHVNGYTQPSLNDIHKMIVEHGGGFMQYLDGKTTVTHIIASNLTPKKIEEFRRYRIVKPGWVVESVKAGSLLPWNSFRLIDEGPGQKMLAFDQRGAVTSEANHRRQSYREQSDVSWYNRQLDTSKGMRSASQRFMSHVSTPTPHEDIDEGAITMRPESLQPIYKSPQDIDTKATSNNGSTEIVLIAPEPLQDVSQSYSDTTYDISTGEFETAVRVDDETMHQPVDVESVDVLNVLETVAPINDNHNLSKRPLEDADEHVAKKRKMTAEEHNAILLADPQLRKSTVVHPGFLEQYYRESRLHHLSTWKSELKSEMQVLADEMSVSQKAKQKKPVGSRRYILHVDFDCFFAAVSLKKHPQYKDKPAVVAHGNGTGSEIASCNYVARKYGVKNGMWMKKALELCSDINVMSYDFPAYEATSRAFYEAIIATGGIVQSVSVDEALVDISMLCFAAVSSDGIQRFEGTVDREQQAAWDIAQRLRDDIKRRTECDVSIGIGNNILLAKLALRKGKPAGQYYVRPDEALDFIGPLDVQDLPGVAWNMASKLEEIGIKLIKDIRDVSKEKLVNVMGPKTGERLWEYARGIDKKEVGDVEIRKSVSAEVNWGVRFENKEQVEEFIRNLCTELTKRLLKERVRGKQLTLKIMRRRADAPLDPPKHLGHGLCDSFSKATQLGVATNATDILTRETLAILKSFGFSPGELRGIGVQMTKLESTKEDGLGRIDGSQRMLQFKTGATRKAAAVRFIEPDPIEDPITPSKPKDFPVAGSDTPKRVAFGAEQLNQWTPSRKPLNIRGTQFVMPTQVDPKVLAELPHDIRSRLIAASAKAKTQAKRPIVKFDDGLPAVLTALPNQSQIDPEVFNALPPEVQNEVRAFYDATPGVVESVEEPSPQKEAESPQLTPSPSKLPVQPPRRRGRPPKVQDVAAGPLSKVNFITSHFRKQTPDTASDSDAKKSKAKATKMVESKIHNSPNKKLTLHPDLEGIDPAYLAALPEEMRKEVILENRLKRLRKENEALAQRRKMEEKLRPKRPKEYLHVPARQPRPTFTAQKISKLPKLRDAISEWIHEFADDGPYSEDSHALGIYISRVVLEESDMGKANACLHWLRWVIEEELDGTKHAVPQWSDALKTIKITVQKAVNERGLGQLNL